MSALDGVAPDEILNRIGNAMRRVFLLPPDFVPRRSTTSADVNGWDSLSHAILIMNVEEEFGIDLPLDQIYALNDVGELADAIRARLGVAG